MGDAGLPLVGHTLEFLHSGLAYSRRYYERFGTVFWTGGFGIRGVTVLGPDGLETVLTNRDRAFSNKDGWDYFIGPFFDRGVMLMDFEEHRHHRRIMQQAFKRDRLVAYLRVGRNVPRARSKQVEAGRWHSAVGILVGTAVTSLPGRAPRCRFCAPGWSWS